MKTPVLPTSFLLLSGIKGTWEKDNKGDLEDVHEVQLVQKTSGLK